MLTFIQFSKMEVLKDDLCFNLDLQGFFLKETFHVTKLAYNTCNPPCFLHPPPHKTLSVKDKQTVNFERGR